MADIELVIKIDADIAQDIINGKNDTPRDIVRSFQATIADAIKNGTPLQKGHGDLIDVDKLIGKIHGVRSITAVLEAPTIIEADKAESEE